jgi:O-antigen/teichoic acid export membrane protein
MAGIYLSVVLGFLGTVVAARTFSQHVFSLFAIVIAATGFFQSLLDLTVEEALVKYGFRYSAQQDWGRFRRLFEGTLVVKLVGATLGAIGLLILAPFAGDLFGDDSLTTPLMIAAAIPIGQSLEGMAGTALLLRGRYDVRSVFLAVSMGLRFTAIVVGSRFGLTQTVLAIVLAQFVATAAVGTAGWIAFHRFPQAPTRALGEHRREILRFVWQSSAATGVLSIRGQLAPLLLGIVTSPSQVGFFRIAQAPQQGLTAVSAPARLVLLTEQTRDWEHGRRRVVLAGVRRYSLIAAGLMVVAVPIFWWLMPDLIRWIYTAKYLPGTDASRVFLLAAAVQFVVGWTKSFPVSIGRPNLRIVTHGVESIVVLPLVCVLGAAYGATGAAIAVLVGMCVFAGMWLGIFLRIPREDGPEPTLVDVVSAGPEAIVR